MILLALACKSPDAPLPALTETGWFEAGTCPYQVLSRTPEDGTQEWFLGDPLRAETTGADLGAYLPWVVDAAQIAAPITTTWDGATLIIDGPFDAATTYTWTIDACGGPVSTTFSTSALGGPLTSGPEALVGSAWALDLGSATWDEPALLGAVVGIYATAPLIVQVEAADDVALRWLGTGGKLDPFEGIVVDPSQAMWTFPDADFTEQPSFLTGGATAVISWEGLPVEVDQLVFGGVFTADGVDIEHATLAGAFDLRHMGSLVGAGDDPEGFCGVLGDLGVQCRLCTDGTLACLDVALSDVPAIPLSPGILSP